MLFSNSKNNNSYIVYEESRLGTEKLYKALKETSSWEISDKTSFIVVAFIYHFFFYRMIMLSKYSDTYISNILKDSLNEMISHVTNRTEEKNELVDICNDIFSTLDTFTRDFSKDSIISQAKYFISLVNNINVNEVFDSVAILVINIHFGALLNDGDSFLKKIS